MAIVDKEKTGYTKSQLAQFWKRRIDAANRVYSSWANHFQAYNLYQYYEGFQWIGDTDVYNRPYVVNLIYSTIETKLPGLLFENPEFNIKPQPYGQNWNFDESAAKALAKQDILNYICRRKDFGLNDKHELAVLDAFFGFGVIEIGYDEDLDDNPYIPLGKNKNPLNNLFCKHIPFDHFRVAANANWDLSTGKWWGYYEFVPNERLEKYKSQLNLNRAGFLDEDSEAAQWAISGKITVGETSEEVTPTNHTKIWKIWDFEHGKFIKIADDNANSTRESILEYEDFQDCGICTIRFTKRRRGWYPLPPVFNWIAPQDEINDIRQTHKIHRKRYQRKYEKLEGAVEQEEVDKFLYGPDGTVFTVNKIGAIKPVEDAPLDTANQQSLIVSYDDFLRVAGGATEQGRVADRTTATQATINNQLAQIREAKDNLAVANFLVQIGNSVLRSLKRCKQPFWAEFRNKEGLLDEIQILQNNWKQVSPEFFSEDDYDIDCKINSVSPVSLQEDKKAFMEFLAVITQYEIIAFSPALLREAAYRVGYRNEAVLNQFQQLAQLMAIGREVQLKGQVKAMEQQMLPQGPAPTQPGTLPEQQVQASTPPDLQEISNLIFNKQGIQ